MARQGHCNIHTDWEPTVKTILTGLITAALLALAPYASAEEKTSEVEIMFMEADQNGNYALDMGEVLSVAIKQFHETDTDADGAVEKEEVGELAADLEFSDNDTNKDGVLSIEELITEKIVDFKAADTDGDGVLTLEEVKEFYEKKI